MSTTKSSGSGAKGPSDSSAGANKKGKSKGFIESSDFKPGWLETGPLPPLDAGLVEVGGCEWKGCSEQPAAASKAMATKVRDGGSIEIPRPRLSDPRAHQIKEDCWSVVSRRPAP